MQFADRKEFLQLVGADCCAVFVVIHVLDEDQTDRNIGRAIAGGAHGVFLINHDFGVEPFLPIIQAARRKYPDVFIGINFLGVTGKYAFPKLAHLQSAGCRIDAYWADDARIDESRSAADQPEADEILRIKIECGWRGLYFGGTAFKKQREVAPEDYRTSAEIAREWMDVVTTSGVATGCEPGTDKINTFRSGVGMRPLALASGVTPDNVRLYCDRLDAILVATGINVDNDFYNVETSKLRELLRAAGNND
ncbi:MAG: adenine phosphoribosyltransferase [Pseudomonadota bacterium]